MLSFFSKANNTPSRPLAIEGEDIMQHDYNGFPGQDRAEATAASFPHRAEVIRHRDYKLLMPLFAAEHPVVLRASDRAIVPTVDHREPVIRDIDTTFDLAKYREPRRPVTFGITKATEISYQKPLPAWARHVLDMPIQFPGSELRLPQELASLASLLQEVLGLEYALNPRARDYYAYLSLQQGIV